MVSHGHEDDYEIVRPIGSGSFGQVFLVLHKREQRQYVMKNIEMKETTKEGSQATELEVQLLRDIHHPNIVAYQDSFINSLGHLCILMEYCEHGDIHSYLQAAKKAQKVPDEQRLLEWFVQITLALHALHTKKILHRDLKTQNIFLTGYRKENIFALKLGDFGIAKVLNSTTDLAKTQIGTPFYMSPELINNKPYSYKSDIWGLGCVLYEIVNGQRAFDAQSLNGLALKIIKGSYTPITASCSQSTKSLIKSMLSKKPTHRPTLKEMLHTSGIRVRITTARGNVIAAGAHEGRQAIENALNDQLTLLGLGALVNCHTANSQRERRKLLQKLQRAERRKKREEEALQHATALLAAADGDHPATRLSTGDVERGSHAPPVHGLDLQHHHTEWDDNDPEAQLHAMSHRDRVLRQKERRREEERHRFEEEARKIREENLAHQAAWVRGGQRQGAGGASSSTRHRSRTEDGCYYSDNQEPEKLREVSWLLDYEHIQPSNLAHPFENRNPKVVHSPRRRARVHQEPSPPPPQYGGHPRAPSKGAPGAGGSVYSTWRTSDGPRRPPVHSARLESLGAPACGSQRTTRSSWPDFSEATYSDDSGDSSGSLFEEPSKEGVVELSKPSMSHAEPFREDVDGLSDVSDYKRRARAKHEQPQVIREKIEQCRAAIHRHRMTIEMLHSTFANDPVLPGEEVERTVERTALPHPAADPVYAFSGDEAPAAHPFSLGLPAQTRRSLNSAPAVVQDTSRRLVQRCLDGLGSELFAAARRCVQDSASALEAPGARRQRLLEMLGVEKIGFLSLIDQLVHMERKWGAQEIMSRAVTKAPPTYVADAFLA